MCVFWPSLPSSVIMDKGHYAESSISHNTMDYYGRSSKKNGLFTVRLTVRVYPLFSILCEDVPKFANPEAIPPHNLTSSLFSTWTCLTAHMWMTPPWGWWSSPVPSCSSSTFGAVRASQMRDCVQSLPIASSFESWASRIVPISPTMASLSWEDWGLRWDTSRWRSATS